MTAGRELADPARAAQRDAEDPLGALRAEFHDAGDGLIYLDGNSLGRLPVATARRLAEAVTFEWGERLIRSWSEGWLELPLTVGDRLGELVLGAAAGQVAVADSTTVCFYKLAAAAIAARPGRSEIVTERGNFPTDRYVLEGLAQTHGLTVRWIDGDPVRGVSVPDLAAVLGAQTALVSLSHVDYRSGAVLDLPALTAAAHQAGALILWDCSHSAGAVPVELDAGDADLAVGCTYKYLNGGPGAPAFLYVAERHQDALRQPVWGWLGREEPFAMAPGYQPARGIAAMLSGTPPVLALRAVEASLELLERAGLSAVRAKGIALTAYAIALADQWLADAGVRVASPREDARRGSHVALAHPRARQLCDALAHRGVITDFREPDIIRLGLSPLTTRFADVHAGLAALRELI